MRRPVGVKWVLGFCWSRLFLCRVAAVAMLPSALELYLTRFIQHAVPTVAISQIQSDGQFLLRNIPALRCCSGANLLHCRSPYLLCFEHVDNLGAYSIPSET